MNDKHNKASHPNTHVWSYPEPPSSATLRRAQSPELSPENGQFCVGFAVPRGPLTTFATHQVPKEPFGGFLKPNPLNSLQKTVAFLARFARFIVAKRAGFTMRIGLLGGSWNQSPGSLQCFAVSVQLSTGNELGVWSCSTQRRRDAATDNLLHPQGARFLCAVPETPEQAPTKGRIHNKGRTMACANRLPHKNRFMAEGTCGMYGLPRRTVEKGSQSNESYEREGQGNRTVSSVL